jgi:hypothetical protein
MSPPIYHLYLPHLVVGLLNLNTVSRKGPVISSFCCHLHLQIYSSYAMVVMISVS